MTVTAVNLRTVTLDLTDVTDIIITDTEDDVEQGGYYVREIRVYGEPVAGSTTKPLVATLRVRSMTESDIDVSTPELTF